MANRQRPLPHVRKALAEIARERCAGPVDLAFDLPILYQRQLVADASAMFPDLYVRMVAVAADGTEIGPADVREIGPLPGTVTKVSSRSNVGGAAIATRPGSPPL